MATIKLNDLSADPKETKPAVQEKKVSKVIQGNVVTRKPSLLSKFKQTFFADDIQSVKSYAVKDVIIPGIKHLFLDSLSMLILGERCYTSSTKRSVGTSYSYNTVYKSKEDREKKRYIERDESPRDYREIILESRGEAESVLDTLSEVIDVYGDASLADLYNCIGVSSNFTDNNYGWNKESFARASYRRVSGGYLLDLPRPHPID